MVPHVEGKIPAFSEELALLLRNKKDGERSQVKLLLIDIRGRKIRVSR